MVIVGETSPFDEITCRLTVRDINGDSHELPAVLDTGFTGYLTMPPEFIEALRLPPLPPRMVTLGDGSEKDLERYAVTVVWFGQDWKVTAYKADGVPLIGMKMMKGKCGNHPFFRRWPCPLFPSLSVPPVADLYNANVALCNPAEAPNHTV